MPKVEFEWNNKVILRVGFEAHREAVIGYIFQKQHAMTVHVCVARYNIVEDDWAVLRICCKFEVKFLHTACDFVHTMLNLLPNNFLGFMILQKNLHTAKR